MSVLRHHLLKVFEQGRRFDGRGFEDYRNISVEYGVSPRSAEGSARVKIGNTEVVAGVKMELTTPYPDTPHKGGIVVNVELLPLSHSRFEPGPPSIDSIELSRVVDRGIRECQYVDFEKLCLESGVKVWNVLIDIYPLNVDGHLFDAAALAAVAALRDTKFPHLNKEGMVDYTQKTTKSLPLQKKIPVACTVLKLGKHLFVDPDYEEFSLSDARLSVCSLDDGNLCALQKGGDVSFSPDEILLAIDLAVKKAKELRKQL